MAVKACELCAVCVVAAAAVAYEAQVAVAHRVDLVDYLLISARRYYGLAGQHATKDHTTAAVTDARIRV